MGFSAVWIPCKATCVEEHTFEKYLSTILILFPRYPCRITAASQLNRDSLFTIITFCSCDGMTARRLLLQNSFIQTPNPKP